MKIKCFLAVLLIAHGLGRSVPVVAVGKKPPGAAGAVSFRAIDRHALEAPKEAERSMASLAAYLVKPAKNDGDKVRAIFRWMTDRIAFNADDFRAGKPVDSSPPAILKSRTCVCEGYANLFVQLCQEAGLEAVKILGFSKGYRLAPGAKLAANHAWNAVKVADQWRLIDVTWGAGSVDGKKGFLKRFEEYYFFPPPESFIFHHFPDEPRWQLLDPAVSAQTFQAWPEVDLQLLKFGASARDIHKAIADKEFRGLVKTFDPRVARVRLLRAPLEKHLEAGVAYHFRLEAPTCLEMAFLNAGSYKFLARQAGGVYEGKTAPRKGTMKLRGRFAGKGNTYWSILEYVVD